MNYSQKVRDLFTGQLRDWDLARKNYSQLADVRTRSIPFGTFDVHVQFNPGRMTSSSAKVDTKSIEARPCFLCQKNRPAQQRGVSYEHDLTILVNPFPIFNRHLTIVSETHSDQRILKNFDRMLSLARDLPDYLVFYNGPQCGASAPDHLHFQAGNRGFLPLEADFSERKHCKLLFREGDFEVWHWINYKRGILTLEGPDAEEHVQVFSQLYERLASLQPDRPEPMFNILSIYDNDRWITHIIPRKQHRPSQYFAEEDNKILVSPAAVDLGGIMITPREEDFRKITRHDLDDIFTQLCFTDDELIHLVNQLLE